MIKNPKFFPLEKDVLDRSIFNQSRRKDRLWYFEPEVINQAIDYSMGLPTHSGSNGNCPRENFFKVIRSKPTKYVPQQVCKTIREALVKKAPNNRKRNSKHPQFLHSVRGVVGKLVFDDLPTLSKVSLSERASPRGLITTKASMKRMMSALKIFSMVQARKETPDHVSVREECLNSSCPKEFSLVGINSAILKTKILSSLMHLIVNYKYRVFTYVSSLKNFGRGICKPIFFIKRVKGITVFTYRFYQRLSKKYQSLACVVALMRGMLFPLYLSKLPITR